MPQHVFRVVRFIAVLGLLLAPNSRAAVAAAWNVPATPTLKQLAFPPAPREPFGNNTVLAHTEDYIARWRSLTTRMRADLDVLRACDAVRIDCPPGAERLLAIVEAGRAHRGRARLGFINRGVNLIIKPATDMAQHGVPDIWSSPLATYSSGKGDCEDYAIAKLAALLLAGIPARDLRLMLVRNVRSPVRRGSCSPDRAVRRSLAYPR